MGCLRAKGSIWSHDLKEDNENPSKRFTSIIILDPPVYSVTIQMQEMKEMKEMKIDNGSEGDIP